MTSSVRSRNVNVPAVISDKYTTFLTFWSRLLAENSLKARIVTVIFAVYFHWEISIFHRKAYKKTSFWKVFDLPLGSRQKTYLCVIVILSWQFFSVDILSIKQSVVSLFIHVVPNQFENVAKATYTFCKLAEVIWLCPPPKGRGTYCFWCGSCWRQRRQQPDTFLFARYLMNRWVDFN